MTLRRRIQCAMDRFYNHCLAKSTVLQLDERKYIDFEKVEIKLEIKEVEKEKSVQDVSEKGVRGKLVPN
ncbi:unnamed protein product [Ilex paraguariensis]|uniref:Uncharacterized protein n=1 Tax=Ilex paraguariensis TaxID=185542 RepID=A0ABC8S7T7_9AQUA